MSEGEEQEQSNGGILDYIMNLESVPQKLPPHLELLRNRVLCNVDAPQHVSIFRLSLTIIIFFALVFKSINFLC